jgi:transposase, IS30 family
MSKYRRIKYEDRCQIYALSKRGSSQESIAEVLGVSQSAVSREIHRNRGERGYRFKQAEADLLSCPCDRPGRSRRYG